MFRTLLVLLASSLPVTAAEPDPMMLLELARAKRTRELVQNPTPSKVTTTCGCKTTDKCLCWEGECSCPACGRGSGGTLKEAGKPQGPASGTTRLTPVPTAGGPPQLGQGPGRSGGTSPEATSMSATGAAPVGITSGCANGQCSSGSTRTYSRGLIFRRW